MQKQVPPVKNGTAIPTSKTNGQVGATEGQKSAYETTQEKSCTKKVTPSHLSPSCKHVDKLPPVHDNDNNVHGDGGDLRCGSNHNFKTFSVTEEGMPIIVEGELACQPSSTLLEDSHAANNDDHDDDDFPLSGQVSGPCENEEENQAEMSSLIDEEEEFFMHKPRPNR